MGFVEGFSFFCLPLFHLLRRGRGRAARRGRRPLDWIGPSSDALVMLVLTFLCPPLFLLVATAATAFENMPLQRSSFKRASRSLAKTGLFLGLFGCLLPPLFFGGSLEVPGGPFGPQWPHWVPIWEPFGSLLGDFLEVGGALDF